MSVDSGIPRSTSRWLAQVPPNVPVAVLLRHSDRDDWPPGETGNDVPLTQVGVARARSLGAVVCERLRTLRTSPLPRCVQTAEAIGEGAARDLPIILDNLLGDPGAYVEDGERALAFYRKAGHEGFMAHLVSGEGPRCGMADPARAAQRLAGHLLDVAADCAGLHIFVTHDSLVAATAARLLNRTLDKTYWTCFLEGAFLWREGGRVATAYRDLRSP